jgi:hypothetical protein
MLDQHLAPQVIHAARRIAAALIADPALARDEMRLATFIGTELQPGPRLSRIPACLRDDR